MFKRKQSGPTCGDCTASYDVFLHQDYTLQKFMDDVVSQYPDEWGNFCITDKDGLSIDIEYSHGIINKGYPDCLIKCPVISVNASGGWSKMDYNIKITMGGND